MPTLRLLPALMFSATVLAAENAADKSAYTLFNPTPAERMRAMNTDRPDTTESPFTVDAGHFQVEASLVDYTRDKSAGVTTRTLAFGSMNLKAGLLNNTDIQFIFDSYADTRTSGAGFANTANGISDLTIRLKQNLWGNEGDTKTAFAIMPYLKAPTGSNELSNGKYEGGFITPLTYAASDRVSLSTMIEADVVWDGAKYGVDWLHSLSCGISLTDATGIYIEYAGIQGSGPSGNYRAYGDFGVTHALNASVVLDAGVRLGLNARAEDFGAFAGISYRH